MLPFDVDAALATLTVLVDTREQDTPAFRKRMKAICAPHKRHKLDFGDYSCAVHVVSQVVNLSDKFAIERKMNLDELAQCYTKGRGRFQREFERAQTAGAKIYLLIENADWESAYSGDYRSRLNPNALIASMLAWLARYNCQLLMCSPDTTPRLIRDICYREAKEYLEKQCDESDLSKNQGSGDT